MKIGVSPKQLHVYLIDDCEYVGAWTEEDALKYYAKSDYRDMDGAGESPDIKIADDHQFCDDLYDKDNSQYRSMIEEAQNMTSCVYRPAFHVGIPSDLL